MRWNECDRKRGARLFAMDQRGSVSVFLIIATSGILLFTTLLIDYARIAAFNKQIELAAQSGARSALSAYDGMLYDRYGLFAAGGTSRSELFARTAKGNWRPDSDESFPLLRIQYRSSHVNSYEVLGAYPVFKRQVLEEMKYKAPIDFTMEVAARFAPVSIAMKEASATVKLLEEVRERYDKREKHLQTVLDLQRQSADRALSGIAELIPVQLVDAVSGSTAASIADGYSAYVSWCEQDAHLEEKEKPQYTEDISNYENTARSVSGDLRKESMHAMRRHQELESKALKELAEAERLNTEMKAVIERIKQENQNTGFDRVNGSKHAAGTPSTVTSTDTAQLREAGQSAEELLLAPDWFVKYKGELTLQTTMFASFDSETSGFQSNVTAALSNHGSSALLIEGAAQLRIAFEQYAQKFIQPGSVLDLRMQEMNERQSADGERKKQEAAAESKLGEVRKMMHGITSIPQMGEHQEMFDQVKEKLHSNLQFNGLAEASGSAAAGWDDDPNDAAVSSMSSMETIFSGMADSMEGIRDSLYLNEYIIHRFASFPPQKLGAVMRNEGHEEFSNALSLNNQEVEYILYGFHSPAGNIAAAYGEIFAVRLAIRTMEGLIACRSLGHPLLVLAGALLYGLEQSIADMVLLSQKGSIPLSKYVDIELTYADYLRIFLLLHGSSDERMSRTIAVIEQNTGMTLSKTSTGITGELTASVNLWFLPGLMRSFTNFGILNGRVKGNRYETTKTIGWSYG
ncbi:hypothetical protein PAECIP111893_00231 [Paenibacillus plantiphilus]|uniref:Flp pilus-assembly TadG-like N-terminal domain-containing protein n=1 Tax=Paenibacillus plantiphilus TaxID=2905650 RepID=A0ABM9BPX9_9BACL|nr:hypothetical protein [Paenibacillus plantiphilus]CAH1190212.1 hypothetical protein PAECIP111893_00231 [Paenibacillus plantiphilus]